MSRRYHTTGCGTPHIVAPGYRYQSDPNARFETDTPMSLTEKIAWCAPMACLTGYAVSVMMGWLPNIVSWVMT